MRFEPDPVNLHSFPRATTGCAIKGRYRDRPSDVLSLPGRSSVIPRVER
jgi:hypothetical protein